VTYRRRNVLAAAVALVLLAACSRTTHLGSSASRTTGPATSETGTAPASSAPSSPASSSSPQSTTPDTTTPDTTTPDTTTARTDSSEPTDSSASTTTKYGPNDDNKIIEQAVVDVDNYWSKEFPALYPNQTYEPFDRSRLYPYGPNNPPPSCGGSGPADYPTVAKNAFYCPEGDFVAWDHAALTPDLLRNFGPLTLGIVIAHELGHRVQNEHGILDGRFITFVTEQQADCFAGAWVQHLRQDGDSSIDASDAALDQALAGFLTIRDPVGTDAETDPRAHGSAFQRVSAFQDGFSKGPEKCRSYEDGSIDFTPETFNDQTDAFTSGNLDYNEVEPLAIANLNAFWSTVLTSLHKSWTDPKVDAFDPAAGVTCGNKSAKGQKAVGLHFYCPDDDSVVWDEAQLMPKLYEGVGDMAVAVVVANAYSERVQHLLGLPTRTHDALLQADCLTGVWAGTDKNGQLESSFPQDAQLSLSPGDLDEVVAGFLQFGRGGAIDGKAPNATAFERVESFRNGFFAAFDNGTAAGLKACGVTP